MTPTELIERAEKVAAFFDSFGGQLIRHGLSWNDYRLAAQALRAVIALRKEIGDTFSCNHPAGDGSDDCADIDDCFLHGALQTIDRALQTKPD